MKRFLSIILFAVTVIAIASCANNTFNDQQFWDGNYIYYNGYKTKTNSTDKIFYLTEFSYNDAAVTIDSYIYSGYYLGFIHFIVIDNQGMYYYIRYDAKEEAVKNVYADNSEIKFGSSYNDYIYFEAENKIIYVNKNGVFPAVNINQQFNCNIIGDYLFIVSQGLKYAKVNGEGFTRISDAYIERFCLYKEKVYYTLPGGTFNIYDINSKETHSFELEEENKIYFNNGTYLVSQINENLSEEALVTMQSYNIYSAYYNFKLIAYDDDCNKITVDLPEELDFSYHHLYSGGIISLVGYEYKANGIITYHTYYFNENLELVKGYYNFTENQPTEVLYNSRRCGIYLYNSRIKTLYNKKQELSFYGTNTETNETYPCFKMIINDNNTPKIIVILPY